MASAVFLIKVFSTGHTQSFAGFATNRITGKGEYNSFSELFGQV
jgi:hypothetical protein